MSPAAPLVRDDTRPPGALAALVGVAHGFAEEGPSPKRAFLAFLHSVQRVGWFSIPWVVELLLARGEQTRRCSRGSLR